MAHLITAGKSEPTAIKMAKPKINNAAVENERKVSVVKRKSGRSSIIAEEYLEKVDKAKQSVKEEQAQENEKKIAPVMKDNSNKNEKDDDKNTTTTTATTTTKSPSSPSSGLVYSVEQLQIGKCPAGIDMARREQYLSDAEFNSAFNMSKDKFDAFNGFQVNEELVSNANDNYLFMHCLPAHRGEEVTDAVIDSKNSIVFDQAENRMWAQMSLLTYMCNPIAWQAYRDLY